jgi:hypothetical protein
MRFVPRLALQFAVLSIVGSSSVILAQPLTQIAATGATATAAASLPPKFTFHLFWKDENAATQAMAASVQAAVAKHPDRASWNSVHVKDPAQQELVAKYRLERAPMPLVLCVAPNGAITSAITQPLTDEFVEVALVTPAMADCMKALQAGKIVVVHVKPSGQTPLPMAAVGIAADPHFKDRTQVISVVPTDPAENRFFKDMDVDRSTLKDSLLIVMAPPKAFIGKFPPTATKDQIAAALAAAGKCCDDPNCQHNQPAK